MPHDAYTPGYGSEVLNFMGQRTAETHAAFFLPVLQKGWRVLDAGCGPGTITLGLARAVAPGTVVGIDVEESQFAAARQQAEREHLDVNFLKASIYDLPFDDHSFDAVFSHAVLTHLNDPDRALIELRRVLRPGGPIGIRASDMGGTLVDSESQAAAEGFAAYLANRQRGAGDPYAGRKLSRLLRNAGFIVDRQTASYEVITDISTKLGPLVSRFAGPGESPASDLSLFVALAWCEAVAHVPNVEPSINK